MAARDWAEERAEREVEEGIADAWAERDRAELGDDGAEDRATLPMDRPHPFAGFQPIDSYTRAQAIADGVLLDVSESARRWGFKFPVALTRAFWASAEVLPVPEEERRLYVLRAVRDRVQKASAEENRSGDPLPFGFVLMLDGGPSEAVGGKIHLGPGDAGEPVFTIMLNEED